MPYDDGKPPRYRKVTDWSKPPRGIGEVVPGSGSQSIGNPARDPGSVSPPKAHGGGLFKCRNRNVPGGG